MTSGGSRFSEDVRKNGSDSAAILGGIADKLAEKFEAAAELRDGLEALHELGLSLVLRLETQAGVNPLRISVAGKGAAVPQWTPEDEALLRALGIAHGENVAEPRRPAKPGRQQPR